VAAAICSGADPARPTEAMWGIETITRSAPAFSRSRRADQERR
jgi:hypothetical protein